MFYAILKYEKGDHSVNRKNVQEALDPCIKQYGLQVAGIHRVKDLPGTPKEKEAEPTMLIQVKPVSLNDLAEQGKTFSEIFRDALDAGKGEYTRKGIHQFSPEFEPDRAIAGLYDKEETCDSAYQSMIAAEERCIPWQMLQRRSPVPGFS